MMFGEILTVGAGALVLYSAAKYYIESKALQAKGITRPNFGPPQVSDESKGKFQAPEPTYSAPQQATSTGKLSPLVSDKSRGKFQREKKPLTGPSVYDVWHLAGPERVGRAPVESTMQGIYGVPSRPVSMPVPDDGRLALLRDAAAKYIDAPTPEEARAILQFRK